LEAKRLGYLLLWPAVSKDRSQRFILPVIGLSGMREIPLKSRIVHDMASVKMSVEVWGFLPMSFYPRSETPADKSERKWLERRLKYDHSTIQRRPRIECEVQI